MSISPTSLMTKTPQPLLLPGQVTLTQEWESDRAAGENAIATYSLSPDNPIWFDGESEPVKSVDYSFRIDFSPTEITHQLDLLRAGGNQKTARITQTVTSEHGADDSVRYFYLVFE